MNFNRIFFTIILFWSFTFFGQKKNQFKINYGLTESTYTSLEDVGMSCGGGPDISFPKKTSEFGFRYSYKFAKYFRLESGVTYASSDVSIKITTYKRFREMLIPGPVDRIIEKKEKLQMLTFPISISSEFGRYFYVNTGVLLGFQLAESEYLESRQSGIGFLVGLGVKYDYQNLSFYFGPELKRHCLFIFEKTKEDPEFLAQFTFALGIAYNF